MQIPMAFLGSHTSTVLAEKIQVSKGQTRLMNMFIMFPSPFLIPIMKQQPTLPWVEAGDLDIFFPAAQQSALQHQEKAVPVGGKKLTNSLSAEN